MLNLFHRWRCCPPSPSAAVELVLTRKQFPGPVPLYMYALHVSSWHLQLGNIRVFGNINNEINKCLIRSKHVKQCCHISFYHLLSFAR